MSKLPFEQQLNQEECGICCLSMIFSFYGEHATINDLRENVLLRPGGLNLRDLKKISEFWGFRTLVAKLTPENLSLLDQPCIMLIDESHFVVLYKAKKNFLIIGDPKHGIQKISKKTFFERVKQENEEKLLGYCLLLEPSAQFYKRESKNEHRNKIKVNVYKHLSTYLKPYKKQLTFVFISLLVSISLELLQPFLTQSLVDIGIASKDFNFIKLILGGQLFLLISGFVINLIRTYFLSHISIKITISQLFDFLKKLRSFPFSFFEKFKVADIMQRVEDHENLEMFIMNNLFNIIFDSTSVVFLMLILLLYSKTIFFIYLAGTILYNIWILFFIQKRRDINYECFTAEVKSSDSIYEMVEGMNDIKLYNYGDKRLWKWMSHQNLLLKLKIKYMWNYQYSEMGTLFLSRFKDLLILIIAANMVVEGRMTIGMMMAIQSIIGQLNMPISHMLEFYNTLMETSVSIERIKSIVDKKDDIRSSDLNADSFKDININNLSYKYSKFDTDMLKNVSLNIQENKMTIIVGESGCGKTTLLKTLLGYYSDYTGSIKVGGKDLFEISTNDWSKYYSSSLQDSFVFSGTILENIVMGEELDMKRVNEISKITCFDSVVENLPKKYLTKVKRQGMGLSRGQRQRMLLARSLYKKSKYIFLDEATNALDPLTERKVIRNLKSDLVNRTIVFITHNLDNVKQADNIIVMDNGEIIESGDFDQLMANQKLFYDLYNANSEKELVCS